MNAIPARFRNFSTTTLHHTQKHYHIISKTQVISSKKYWNRKILEETFLATLDAKHIYTNTLNHESVKAAKEALKSVPNKSDYQIFIPNINIKQLKSQ